MQAGASTPVAVAIAVLLLWGFAGCGEPDRLQEEILILQDRIRPPGASFVEKPNLVRNSRTASARWEYETDWDWEKYTTWVADNLAAHYEPIKTGKTKMQFRRRLPGDVFELQIESRMSSAARRILVNFYAFPG